MQEAARQIEVSASSKCVNCNAHGHATGRAIVPSDSARRPCDTCTNIIELLRSIVGVAVARAHNGCAQFTFAIGLVRLILCWRDRQWRPLEHVRNTVLADWHLNTVESEHLAGDIVRAQQQS